MPSETLNPPRETALDFISRADPANLLEWMDEPCVYEEFRDCLADLERVNRLTLAYRPTLSFLHAVLERQKLAESVQGEPHQPLHIVDVGCGGGDTLRRLARWAARRKLAVKLTGIDLNPYARRYAEELEAARHPNATTTPIQWITGDAFAFRPAVPVDAVISSLLTHHLPDGEIVRFLSWMEETAQHGWFINDLLRSSRSYRVFGALSRLVRWHSFVQHDGPVSIRRAFREDDWRRLAFSAAIPATAFSLERWSPGRLCVRRLK